MKSVYNTHLYPPSCIYNMDETFFQLGSSRKSRRIGPISLPSNKAVALPASGEHITVMACIGINDAPVPPVILYKGAAVQKSWTAVMEKDVPQLVEATDSGWTNGYIAQKWLEKLFDRYTSDVYLEGNNVFLLWMDTIPMSKSTSWRPV